jgi:hypothetical protein
VCFAKCEPFSFSFQSLVFYREPGTWAENRDPALALLRARPPFSFWCGKAGAKIYLELGGPLPPGCARPLARGVRATAMARPATALTVRPSRTRTHGPHGTRCTAQVPALARPQLRAGGRCYGWPGTAQGGGPCPGQGTGPGTQGPGPACTLRG